MKVLVIGSGISGLTTAIECAKNNINVVLVSPLESERSQSIMAAGGICAAILEGDSYVSHKDDTLKGGCFIENENTLLKFCEEGKNTIEFLKESGVIFSRDEDMNLSVRNLGGHSHKRALFSKAATGKQIVTALTNKCLEYEVKGLVDRKLNLQFYSALIKDGKVYGALFLNNITNEIEVIYADNVVFATGGQNQLFGKTTGSLLCDGYAAAKLFTQGVELRNLEFIQYHPTSIETEHKKMLITEGARGEGGRLFYFDGDKKVYFMEDKYGEKGNLMPRDICAREIYNTNKQVYLDITFLGEEHIHKALEEVYDECMTYLHLDPTKEYIPVSPCIHFFMGGIKVNDNHETNINNLFAVGECASKYHGANRLGGNSLLAAVYSGRVCAKEIANKEQDNNDLDFSDYINNEKEYINKLTSSKSLFPSVYILRDLAKLMNDNLGIVRDETRLNEGLQALEFDLKTVENIKFDPTVSIYENYRLKYLLIMSKAILLSALERKESRGAHFRSDYPQTLDEYKKVSVVRYNDGNIIVSMEEDK